MHTKLTNRETVAEGTMRFYFEKPEGLTYIAGQTIDLTLENPPETDAEGNTRTFSLVSAPHEHELSITTRMRDTAFKRTLKSMAIGTGLSLEGPMGSFRLHTNEKRPAVFLAGGIGITPFFSMIKDALHRKLPYELCLFYSNRRPEDTAFLADLQSLADEHKNFHLIATMTDMEKSRQSWSGERGYLDEAMLGRHLGDLTAAIFYIAGPLGMVAAMHKMLSGVGVSEDDIRFEEFAGY